MSVRNPKDAEAAVREMNGQAIQGHALHVEHFHKSPADGQATSKESCVQLSPAAYRTEVLITHSSNNNVRASRVSITQQTLSEMREIKALYCHNACISEFTTHPYHLSPLE